MNLISSDRLTCLSLFLFAFSIRLVGVDYGYLLGDERINDAAKFLTGQLIPGQHFYPPLFNYINGVAFGLLFAIGKFAGWWADAGGFRAQYFEDPTAFYITARAVTAASGALMAPLFYAFARVLCLAKHHAFVIALLGAAAPIAVYFSYIAKSDIPLATATVLTALIFLKKVRVPLAWRWDVALGASAALALSFKHSIVIFLAPLLVAHAILLLNRIPLKAYIRSLAISLLSLAVLWPVLNIGIVLDLENFISFQKIQAVMSVKEDASFWASVSLWFGRATSLQWGIGWVMVFGYMVTPFWLLSSRNKLLSHDVLIALWAVTFVAMLTTVYLVRMRQPEHFWIAHFAIMQLLASLVLVDMLRQTYGWVARLCDGALVLSGVLSVLALALLWKQTLAEPMTTDISAVVREDFADRKIVTGVELSVPQKMEAQQEEFARINRVAAKYNVVMPERNAARYILEDAEGAIFYVPMPVTMWGLEDATDEDLGPNIQPYAWPLQQEEWKLPYWLDQGFDVFIVPDLPYLLNETPSLLMQVFYAELVESCRQSNVIPPRKPLFVEREVTIFDCREAA